VVDFGSDKMLEMSGEHDDPLDLPVVPESQLRLIVKYSDRRTVRAA
jgi:hypothetical protein